MDQVTLTALIQGIVQIIAIVGSIWALFNKKAGNLEKKFDDRLSMLDSKLSSMQRDDYRRP